MRASIIKSMRAFFEQQNFIEVETPAMQICPTMDAHIHAFETRFKDRFLNDRHTYYLQASPEFDMKKLLVAGMSQIYQICHVFRNSEISRNHSPEFTMLEWYRTGANYRDIMNDCMGLLRKVTHDLDIGEFKSGALRCDPFREWQKISVVEAFAHYAGMDLTLYLEDTERFANVLGVADIRVAENDSWEDMFFAVMAEKIEPHLGVGQPTILYDYPISMAALSRKKSDDPRYAERFELYVCGIELANAFSELTDPEIQRARYEEEMRMKEERYGYRYPPDEEFFKALDYGLPGSGGIALGVDRLVMLATGASDINDILWAPVQAGTARDFR